MLGELKLFIKDLLISLAMLKVFVSKKLKEVKVILSFILSGIITNIIVIKLLKYFSVSKEQNSDIKKSIFDYSSIEILLTVLFSISVVLLFTLPFFIMNLQQDERKKNRYYFLGVILIGYLTLSFYLYNYKEVVLLEVLYIYFSITYFIYTILEVFEVIYNWLWEATYIKGNKIKKKYRRLDTKKLSLVWVIIIFILGILFNFKK